ncbi:MAG: FliH/SctL family protein, partial [Candidatus Poribacteria bacterium]
MKFPSFDSIYGTNNDDIHENELANIEEQAKILLDQTEKACEEMINKAQIEAENIKKNAFQSGYNNGIVNAKKESEKITQEITQVFMNAVSQLSNVKDEIIKNAEKDIIELTLTIAKKLVCSELRQNPDLIVEIIKEAIKTARTDDEIIIRLNPQDRILLEQNSKEIIKQFL